MRIRTVGDLTVTEEPVYQRSAEIGAVAGEKVLVGWKVTSKACATCNDGPQYNFRQTNVLGGALIDCNKCGAQEIF